MSKDAKHKPTLPTTHKGKPIADLQRGEVIRSDGLKRKRLTAKEAKNPSGPIGTRPTIVSADWTTSNQRTLNGAINKIRDKTTGNGYALRILGRVVSKDEEDE